MSRWAARWVVCFRAERVSERVGRVGDWEAAILRSCGIFACSFLFLFELEVLGGGGIGDETSGSSRVNEIVGRTIEVLGAMLETRSCLLVCCGS